VKNSLPPIGGEGWGRAIKKAVQSLRLDGYNITMKTINQSNVSPFALVFSKNHAKQGMRAEF
jgi:hypothetical protein